MYGKDKNPIQLYLIVLFAFAAIITMLCVGYNLDIFLAKEVYNPTSQWAWQVRQYSNIPNTVISLLAVAFMLIPFLRFKFPLLRKVFIVWLSALIIGGGVLVNLAGKETFERPRPRQEVLLSAEAKEELAEAGSAQIKGKSFPSGHVAMAIMLAVPFFPLRRRHPKTAYLFLISGLAYGGLIGYARMVLGAHFLTDVVWSITIVLGVAAITEYKLDEDSDLKTRYFLPFLLLLGIGGILVNNFNLTLFHSSEETDVIAHLPCHTFTLQPGEDLTFEVNLEGYGAPVSNVVLKEKEATVLLDKTKGLYRGFKCDATVTVPAGKSVWLPTGKRVVNPELFPIRLRGMHAIYYGK